MRDQRRPRLGQLVVLAAAAVGLVAVTIIALSGLASPDPTDASRPVVAIDTPAAPMGVSQLFAYQIAGQLFNWDTATDTPAAIIEQLASLGDPAGQETPGLVGDIDQYLPSLELWHKLRQYQTRQHLIIDTIKVPTAWPGIVATTRPGLIRPGTLAYTISGTRHRDGIISQQPAAADRPISFTMFITCTSWQCYLLRLSAPNRPLP